MLTVRRHTTDGRTVLEPMIGEDVDRDDAILDRLAVLTTDQRRTLAYYVVSDGSREPIETYRYDRSTGMLHLTWGAQMAWRADA